MAQIKNKSHSLQTHYVKPNSMEDSQTNSSVPASDPRYIIPENPGAIPPEPDTRDALYGAFETTDVFAEEFELPRLGNIHNQADKPSCVGETGSRIVEYANRKEGYNVSNSGRYLYGWAKQTDGLPNFEGTTVKEVLKYLINKGCSPLTVWPDDVSLSYAEYIKKPSPEADNKAIPYKIKGYVALTTPAEIKDYITKYELPVFMGVNGNNTAWGGAVVTSANNYTFQRPIGSLVGHLVTCVGWNSRGWRIENSWTEYWADGGRATIPYDFPTLQQVAYGIYDLPTNWPDINNNYKETAMTLSQVNAIQYALYRMVRGTDPKPEELAAVNARNKEWLNALNVIGGDKGQAIIDRTFADFREEFRKNVQNGTV